MNYISTKTRKFAVMALAALSLLALIGYPPAWAQEKPNVTVCGTCKQDPCTKCNACGTHSQSGKTHTKAACGSHNKCDNGDHGNASCDDSSHYKCDGLDHGKAVCKEPSHFKCDGYDHTGKKACNIHFNCNTNILLDHSKQEGCGKHYKCDPATKNKSHGSADCGITNHYKCDGKTHDSAGCNTSEHYNCDGKDHKIGDCGDTSHFNCDGKDHKIGDCGDSSHFNCDGKDHTAGGCGDSSHFNCDGKDHNVGGCGDSSHFNCDDKDHNVAGCGDTSHFKCDDKDHSVAGCGDTSHFKCDDKDHSVAGCGDTSHFKCDDKDHSVASCGQDKHFKCDDKDHSVADCGKDEHFKCDGKDHEPADCGVDGHYKCDGKDHEKCKCECDGDGSGVNNTAANAGGGLNSIHFYFKMGQLNSYKDAGRMTLDIKNSQMTPEIYTPSFLKYNVKGSGVEKIKNPANGYIRQVKVPDCTVDIVHQPSLSKYTVKFYYPEAVASIKNSKGLYQFTGKPFAEWVVENPDYVDGSSTDPHNRLKFSRNLKGSSEVYLFSYNNSVGKWGLSKGAAGEVTEYLERTALPSGITVEKRSLEDASGQVASIVGEKKKKFDFNDEAIVETVIDPDGLNLKTVKAYYTTTSSKGYGKLKSVSKYDGKWEKYSYTQKGYTQKKLLNWKDATALTATDTNASRIEYGYSAVDKRDVLVTAKPVAEPAVREEIRYHSNGESYKVYINYIKYREPAVDYHRSEPREKKTYAEGKLIKTVYTVYEMADGAGIETKIREVAVPATAAYGALTNQRIREVYYTDAGGVSSLYAGRLKSRTNADGTTEIHSYSIGHLTVNAADPGSARFVVGRGDYIREEVVYGTTVNPSGIAGKSLKKVKYSDNGRVKYRETYVKTDSGYERLSWQFNTHDKLGHTLTSLNSNGLLTEDQWGLNCCGKEGEIDAYGTEYGYTYDSVKRRTQTVKYGAPAYQSYPAIAETITEYTYDAAGRVTSETLKSGSSSMVIRSTEYDLAGRVTKQTDKAGIETLYTYSVNAQGNRVQTMTRAGGTTQTTFYLDGKVKLVTSTAGPNRFYNYTVTADGLQVETVYTGNGNISDLMWSKTYKDTLGRVVKTERNGVYGTNTWVSETFYNEKGQVIKKTGYNSPDTLFEYNELGNVIRQGVDVDGNGALEPIGMDRINDSVTYFEKDASSHWWKVSESSTYINDNDDTELTTSKTKTRISGFAVNVAAETVSIDVNGNQTVSKTVIDRANKLVKQQVTYADSDTIAESVSINGKTVSRTDKTGHSVSYGYDLFGRQTTTTDGRTGTTTTHYDVNGRVDYTEESRSDDNNQASPAAGNRTTYGYDSYGRCISVKNADNKYTYYSYYPSGKVHRTWGETTYPIEYSYDTFGRQTELKTYKGGSGWNSSTWPAVTGTAAVTSWTYDTATGLKTSKTYANGDSTVYVYDAADGRLSEVKSYGSSSAVPRRIVEYSYNSLGQQSSIKYKNGGTLVVEQTESFTYNRIGQLKTVTDAVGSRTFNYDGKGRLTSEVISGSIGKTINYSYDNFGREAGVDISGTAYDVNYTYDSKGRFGAVVYGTGASSKAWNYGYLANFPLIDTVSSPNGMTRRVTYENDRNLIDNVQTLKSDGTTVISSFDYTNDVIGRRTQVVKSGTAFSQNDTVNYTYNDRSELTGAVAVNDSSYNYDYSFDNIGSRASTAHNGEVTTYVSNEVNQYTSVSSVSSDGSSSPVVNQSFDCDGNQLTGYFGGRSWNLTWNLKNRLTAMESGSDKIEFVYDYMGRKVGKKVFEKDQASNYQLKAENYYIYDKWNLIQEYENSDPSNPNSQFLIRNSFVWGLDASQTITGAGGVGGLLAVDDGAAMFYPTYDANGNVSEYVDGSENVVAHYEYSPFGKTVASIGAKADSFNFRFSTKYAVTADFGLSTFDLGLYYYGHRHYNAETGAWLSRDPIEEQGGLNLYGFVGNNVLNKWDYLGNDWWEYIPVISTIGHFFQDVSGDAVDHYTDATPTCDQCYTDETLAITTCENKIKEEMRSFLRELLGVGVTFDIAKGGFGAIVAGALAKYGFQQGASKAAIGGAVSGGILAVDAIADLAVLTGSAFDIGDAAAQAKEKYCSCDKYFENDNW